MSDLINVYAAQCDCGEAPVWLKDRNELIFVDTGDANCYIYSPGCSSREKMPVQGFFQTIARAEEEGFIAALPDKVVLCDSGLNIIKEAGNPLSDKPYMMINDGTVGPDGCFYFGIVNTEDLYSKEGVIARVRPDLSIDIAADNLALPNGIAFDSSGANFYVTEMFANTIHRYDFSSSSSELSGRTVFAEIPEENGMPDGLIIDAEGFLWSAHWQGFRITRYDPDGKIERTIPMPVPTPTCMAFGGKDMTTLFITTAKKGLSEEQLRDYPESGDLFRIETEIKGREERVFRL